jgi:hypothetical protein
MDKPCICRIIPCATLSYPVLRYSALPCATLCNIPCANGPVLFSMIPFNVALWKGSKGSIIPSIAISMSSLMCCCWLCGALLRARMERSCGLRKQLPPRGLWGCFCFSSRSLLGEGCCFVSPSTAFYILFYKHLCATLSVRSTQFIRNVFIVYAVKKSDSIADKTATTIGTCREWSSGGKT